MANRFILALSCRDTLGIVHAVAGFLNEGACNIIESRQFGDPDTGLFFMRVSFEPTAQGWTLPDLKAAFQPIGDRFAMDWGLFDEAERPRVLIMVSKFDHCLRDLLYRQQIGNLRMDVPAIVSNHRDTYQFAAWHNIPFHHLPVTKETKAAQEAKLVEIIEAEKVELVVLARYMQILSEELTAYLSGRAINIHHSFLPSFKGARPYQQAHARGVKLIGATAHYVTADLDEGPIIEQGVARVDHSMTSADFVAAGRDVECSVLSRAVRLQIERRIMLNGTRTVVLG